MFPCPVRTQADFRMNCGWFWFDLSRTTCLLFQCLQGLAFYAMHVPRNAKTYKDVAAIITLRISQNSWVLVYLKLERQVAYPKLAFNNFETCHVCFLHPIGVPFKKRSPWGLDFSFYQVTLHPNIEPPEHGTWIFEKICLVREKNIIVAWRTTSFVAASAR